MSIAQALHEWSALSEKIRAMYPELAEDDQALLDTIEGETNLTEKLTILVRSAEEDRTMAAALSIRISEMGDRLKRIEQRMDRKRELAAAAMEQCSLKRLNAPDFTVSLSAGRPHVVITNEAELPASVMVQPPPKPSKEKIAALFKSGSDVPGASLANPAPHISVRRS